jgi:hypothetical protein
MCVRQWQAIPCVHAFDGCAVVNRPLAGRRRTSIPCRDDSFHRTPLGFAGGDADLCRYVGNRPSRLTDPSGRAIFKCGKQQEFFATCDIGCIVLAGEELFHCLEFCAVTGPLAGWCAAPCTAAAILSFAACTLTCVIVAKEIACPPPPPC